MLEVVLSCKLLYIIRVHFVIKPLPCDEIARANPLAEHTYRPRGELVHEKPHGGLIDLIVVIMCSE